MKQSLPDSLHSAQDLAAAILELRAYARWQTHDATKKQLHAGSAGGEPVLSPAASELLQKAARSAGLDMWLHELEVYAKTAQTVTITLAAPAGGGLKRQLVAWCRQNIAPDVLVNFGFNSTLLGGMVVRHGSHIYDWSFRRQILDAKGRFTEVLRYV